MWCVWRVCRGDIIYACAVMLNLGRGGGGGGGAVLGVYGKIAQQLLYLLWLFMLTACMQLHY